MCGSGGGSSWPLGGVFVCVCLSARVCIGGGVFWRQSSSLSTGACWTQHLVLSLPPRLAFSFHLTTLSSFIFVTKDLCKGVVLPSNVNFTLIKDGVRFEKDACFVIL